MWRVLHFCRTRHIGLPLLAAASGVALVVTIVDRHPPTEALSDNPNRVGLRLHLALPLGIWPLCHSFTFLLRAGMGHAYLVYYYFYKNAIPSWFW